MNSGTSSIGGATNDLKPETELVTLSGSPPSGSSLPDVEAGPAAGPRRLDETAMTHKLDGDLLVLSSSGWDEANRRRAMRAILVSSLGLCREIKPAPLIVARATPGWTPSHPRGRSSA
jgi:hypothetical protein